MLVPWSLNLGQSMVQPNELEHNRTKYNSLVGSDVRGHCFHSWVHAFLVIFPDFPRLLVFFGCSRERLRERFFILLNVEFCDKSSHVHIFTSSDVHILTSSHLHIFKNSHLHIFTSSHLLIFTSSHLLSLSFSLSLSLSISLSLSLSLSLTLSCPLSRSLFFFFFFFSLLRRQAMQTRRHDMATLSHEMRFACQKLKFFCRFGWSGGLVDMPVLPSPRSDHNEDHRPWARCKERASENQTWRDCLYGSSWSEATLIWLDIPWKNTICISFYIRISNVIDDCYSVPMGVDQPCWFSFIRPLCVNGCQSILYCPGWADALWRYVRSNQEKKKPWGRMIT